ncbi:MAG: tagaturonate reductase [Clostridia bacterium]|nr:tagaturonate reductase [Clostridia bacterium]
MKETILQFGTGNFLRAFFDVFIDRLQKAGLYDGGVVIVSPTDSKNIDLINRQNGRWHVLERGVMNGQVSEKSREIGCVTRAVNPYRDFAGFLELAENPELRFVVSNTTEAGIAFDPGCRMSDAPAASFPGKVTQLLYRRFSLGLPGLVFLPCELIDDNAAAMKDAVLRYAGLWELPAAFVRWTEEENAFCNTLVDRIVTGRPADAADWEASNGADPLLDAAEPYCFWAIEGNYEAGLPLQAAGVNAVWADDISFYKKRKVRVLNGAHTTLVFPAMLSGIETVGESVADGTMRRFLQKTLFTYVLPLLGETPENLAFTGAVLERFANPFIAHKFRSIALNSVSKFRVRVLPTMLEYHETYGEYPKTMLVAFAALIRWYKTEDPADDADNVRFIKESGLPEILKNEKLWGRDLSAMLPDLQTAYDMDVSEAITWSLS